MSQSADHDSISSGSEHLPRLRWRVIQPAMKRMPSSSLSLTRAALLYLIDRTCFRASQVP
jgi:hypothetical protein